MIIREIRAGEEPYWDEYVQKCEYSTPQHLFAWKDVMEEVFNSKTHYLLAEESGSIKGVLPLIEVKSLLAGHYFTSMPGGICTTDEEAARLLFDTAQKMVDSTNANYLILRDGKKKWDLPGVNVNEAHVTFINQIPSDLDQIKTAMRRNTRQIVNQISNDGLVSSTGIEHLDIYYPVYARAMRELGTPTLGLDFFKNLFSHLPRNTELITLSSGGKTIGGGFISPHQATIFCLWSGLLHQYYDRHIAYLLTWESIRYAHDHGYTWIDLGRCQKNSGGYDFKRRFGGQEQQLYQHIYLNRSGRSPDVGAERRSDIRYQYFTSLWRLIPLPLAEKIGPFLRKQMPFG